MTGKTLIRKDRPYIRLKSRGLAQRKNGRRKRNKIFFMSENAMEYQLMRGSIIVNRGMR
jgi:hypothetical protein